MIASQYVVSVMSLVVLLQQKPTLYHVDASSLAATTDMVWSDEFTTLLRTNWNVATSDSFVPSAGIQTFTSDSVAISGKDYLTITTDKTSSTSFESGQVDTYNKVHFQYCTVTARIKIPNTTTGLVPTFYTQGVNTSKVWPYNGEIDIMKVGQGNASATGSGNERAVSGIHYVNGDGNYYSNTGSRDCGTDLSSNYYIYTLDWTPTTITTFYNDRQIWSTDIGNCNDNDDCTEFHQPHYMLFLVSVGGSFPSNTCTKLGAASASGGTIPNACSKNDELSASDITATVPATMSVDWVRIYDNGYCQLTVVDNDGSNSIPKTPVAAPIESNTGASNPVPVGSSSGGSAGSPAGSTTGGSTPGLSPTGVNTAPGGSSPVGSDSGVKYTFPPNLSPISSDSGGSSGLAPAGSDSGSSSGLSPTSTDSGGSSGVSPTSTDSGGSSGLSPTSSVTGPAGSAPVPTLSIPIPPEPVAVPVPVTPPVVPPFSAPVMPRPVQPQVSAPAITPPTVSVVQPPPVDGKKGKKKCKVKTVSPPGVVSGDGTGSAKGSGKGGSGSGVVSGDGTGASGKGGKGEGKGGDSSGSNSNSDSGVTGDSNTTDSNIFAPSPSSTSGDNVDSPSSGYLYRQRQRRAGHSVSVTSKQQARRKEQLTTPNSVGGGNTGDAPGPGVISGNAEDELDCEDVTGSTDALSVDSSSRTVVPVATMTLVLSVISVIVVTWIA